MVPENGEMDKQVDEWRENDLKTRKITHLISVAVEQGTDGIPVGGVLFVVVFVSWDLKLGS